jgi:hypothetical protein
VAHALPGSSSSTSSCSGGAHGPVLRPSRAARAA